MCIYVKYAYIYADICVFKIYKHMQMNVYV